MITVDVANQQTQLPLEEERLEEAVRVALAETGLPEARISLAVVDDATIGRLNRRFLGHEGATDVLSFLLERTDQCLEGEVVVSAETARRVAAEFGWTPAEELLLYVVHGTLHLAGYDDATAADRVRMRRRERACLARCGIDNPQGRLS
ncbi:MAG: rRNA maturation RNase YbeY [Thermoguttaceae bacterium]|jgi:probable rRNA maturation factor